MCSEHGNPKEAVKRSGTGMKGVCLKEQSAVLAAEYAIITVCIHKCVKRWGGGKRKRGWNKF
jgi:hypothetical protein